MTLTDTLSPHPLLVVDRLGVTIPRRNGVVHAVNDVSFTLDQGSTLGLVGESGCGKTILCRAILNLLPPGAVFSDQSSIRYNGNILNQLPAVELNRIRGREIGMIFQNPLSSLNPVMSIGDQLAEPCIHHLGLSRKEALDRSARLLVLSGISQPQMRLKQYPHQLSGGQRQRVAIAIALSCKPKLLIADEPSTSLDVTVQAAILDLLERYRQDDDMAMILVTHNLSVAISRCQDIAVMYGGKIVEKAPAETLLSHMKMVYTRALFDSIPRLEHLPYTPLKTINGQPPGPAADIKGCRFAPRCIHRRQRCVEEEPPLISADGSPHKSACWYPLPAARGGISTP